MRITYVPQWIEAYTLEVGDAVMMSHVTVAQSEFESAQLDKLALPSMKAADTPPQAREKSVIGPAGDRLTLDDLPLPNTQRWVIRRKAEIVAAVRGGLLSLDDACSRYGLHSDEIVS